MSAEVRLGPIGPGSVAATTFVLVERGCARHPHLVGRLPPVTRIVFLEAFPPVRVAAGPGPVVVGDDALAEPAPADLVVRAPLPALLAQLTVPLAAGVPSPLRAEGRAVLRSVADGTVSVDGRMADALTLLRLLTVRG